MPKIKKEKCEHTFICDYCINCGAYYISYAVKEQHA